MRNTTVVSALLGGAILMAAVQASAQTSPEAADYRADALEILPLIQDRYAYLDRFPDGQVPTSPALRTQAENVTDARSLLGYAGSALFGLADHHAITGRSFSDDWALVPSYADLWIVLIGDDYVVDAVRAGFPAEAAGVKAGDRLTAVADQTTQEAVGAFWAALGLTADEERAAFAARVLAAGRRDRPRVLTFADPSGNERRLTLASLYEPRSDLPRLERTVTAGGHTIRINDALGDRGLIAEFDAAMADVPADAPLLIDLSDTPSGGNTVIARAILGWFVQGPSGYQVHSLPSEERETGIARQWVEQVLPRVGKHHSGPVTVRVGRWTGSMGEGLAIGFDALGARVEGGAMAGLLGGISDLRLPRSGLVIKIPTERLSAVNGTPREDFMPHSPRPPQAEVSALLPVPVRHGP